MERRRMKKLTEQFIGLYKIVLVSTVSVLFELFEDLFSSKYKQNGNIQGASGETKEISILISRN